MTDYISRQAAIDAVYNTEPIVFDTRSLEPHQKTKDVTASIYAIPAADVVEVGKPYFYEQGYIFKDFNNGGEHRYFVIERADK